MDILPQINHGVLTKKPRYFIGAYPSFIGVFPNFCKKSNKVVANPK
jgi:hypothetical protein